MHVLCFISLYRILNSCAQALYNALDEKFHFWVIVDDKKTEKNKKKKEQEKSTDKGKKAKGLKTHCFVNIFVHIIITKKMIFTSSSLFRN